MPACETFVLSKVGLDLTSEMVTLNFALEPTLGYRYEGHGLWV